MATPRYDLEWFAHRIFELDHPDTPPEYWTANGAGKPAGIYGGYWCLAAEMEALVAALVAAETAAQRAEIETVRAALARERAERWGKTTPWWRRRAG